MDGFGSGGDTEERRRGVEGHAVDTRWGGAAAEMIELVYVWDGEDADDSALVRGSGEERARVVEGNAGEWGPVGFDHVDRLEFQGVEDEDVAAGGGYVSSARRSVGGRGKGGGNGFLGEGIGKVAVFR